MNGVKNMRVYFSGFVVAALVAATAVLFSASARAQEAGADDATLLRIESFRKIVVVPVDPSVEWKTGFENRSKDEHLIEFIPPDAQEDGWLRQVRVYSYRKVAADGEQVFTELYGRQQMECGPKNVAAHFFDRNDTGLTALLACGGSAVTETPGEVGLYRIDTDRWGGVILVAYVWRGAPFDVTVAEFDGWPIDADDFKEAMPRLIGVTFCDKREPRAICRRFVTEE